MSDARLRAEGQAKLKGDVIDLMARLKASLESRGGRETSRRAAASNQEDRTAAKRSRRSGGRDRKGSKSRRVA